ncbi:hypothetical protein CRYUN_Cryun14cG0133600 [Craigia yunnanensis]
MSTLEVRGPSLRGYRRRKAMLDLNVPPSEIREHEGTLQRAGPEEVTSRPVQPSPAATIDVEAIDDDVIESSARAFAEAKNNSRRSHGRTVLVDVDSGWSARSTNNNQNRRRRLPPTPTVINCDHYINLESATQSTVVKEIIKPQPPPKEPTFNCPICMGSLIEEMSTRCGHIFCKACIKAAIAAQGKCPTCRKRVTVKFPLGKENEIIGGESEIWRIQTALEKRKKMDLALKPVDVNTMVTSSLSGHGDWSMSLPSPLVTSVGCPLALFSAAPALGAPWNGNGHPQHPPNQIKGSGQPNKGRPQRPRRLWGL